MLRGAVNVKTITLHWLTMLTLAMCAQYEYFIWQLITASHSANIYLSLKFHYKYVCSAQQVLLFLYWKCAVNKMHYRTSCPINTTHLVL